VLRLGDRWIGVGQGDSVAMQSARLTAPGREP